MADNPYLREDTIPLHEEEAGRWPNRDPLQELGGLNLYGFAENDGINKSDSNGGELFEAAEATIADLAVQISVNYATGEHLYHISVTSVAVAAGLGLAGVPDIKDTGQLINGIFNVNIVQTVYYRFPSGKYPGRTAHTINNER